MLPLLSLQLLVLLVVAATACLAAAVAVAVRKPRRWRLPLVAASVVSALLLGTGAAAVGVNRHFVLYRSWRSLFGLYSRDLVAARSPQALERALAPLPVGVPARKHGELLSLRIPGTASGLPVGNSLVYLPPQYGSTAWAGRRFPVVEAIPGSPGAPGDYVNGIQADTQLDAAMVSHRLPPAIVVFPPSNLSVLRSLECVDTADGLRDETFLTVDVRSWVTAHLQAAPGRWSLLGYSTGGYCALDLSLRHPDLFARAASLDGYAHALDDHYARGLWPRGLDGVLARLEHSPDWWVLHHQPEPVDIYLSAGTRDRDAAVDAVRLWRLLGVTGWRTGADRLVVEPHAHHTFAAWARAFVPALEWALRSSPPGSPLSEDDALAQLTAVARPSCPTAVAPSTTSSGTAAVSPAPASASSCRVKRGRPQPAGPGPLPSPSAAPSPRRSNTPSPRPTPRPTPTSRPSGSTSPAP